jgi:hypothetical protein
MSTKFFKQKWQKRLLVSLGIFVGAILILALLVNLYWSPILASRVKSTVQTSTDGLYTIDFSDAKLHIIKGEIDIYNIILKPDTAVYNRKLKEHLAPNNLVEMHVKRLILSHIHPFKLYFQHKLDIGQITLREPQLDVSYQLNHSKDTLTKDNRTTWQKMRKTLRTVHIGQISLSDIKLHYKDYSGNKLAFSELKEMNLTATDLLIDSLTQTDRSRLLYCKDIVAELNNYSGRSPNGLYTYKIKSLRLSTQTSKLNIEGLDLKPVKPDVFFRKSNRDRFDLHLDSLEINHFDYLSYHKYRVISASRMLISRGSFDLFNNPNKKPATSDKEKTYPNYGLKEIRADLNLDTIDIKHINVSYTEYSQKSGKTGNITFENSSGRILNVTTNKVALEKNNICTARLSARFMGKGELEVFSTFNLTADSLPFTYKGRLGPMDLTEINPAIMPLGLIKVKTGRLTSFDFDVEANNTVSKGRISILYNDLKVVVLKADTANDKLKHLTIASLYANLMVLKHNNPDSPQELPRTTDVTYYRPRDYPFFKNIWHTLLTGIKPCVGLDEKMQQDVKNKMADMVIKKQNRLIKKAQRQERREERRRKRALAEQQKNINKV